MEFIIIDSEVKYAIEFERSIHHKKGEVYVPDTSKGRNKFDRHGILAVTKGQGGCEWRFTYPWHLTSTVVCHVLPQNQQGLTETQVNLLSNCLEFELHSDEELQVTEPNLSYSQKSESFLIAMTRNKLMEICKSYN